MDFSTLEKTLEVADKTSKTDFEFKPEHVKKYFKELENSILAAHNLGLIAAKHPEWLSEHIPSFCYLLTFFTSEKIGVDIVSIISNVTRAAPEKAKENIRLLRETSIKLPNSMVKKELDKIILFVESPHDDNIPR